MKYTHMDFISINLDNQYVKLLKDKAYTLYLVDEKYFTEIILTELFWDDGVFYIKYAYHDSKHISVEQKVNLLQFNQNFLLGKWKLLYTESTEGIYNKRNTKKYDTKELEEYMGNMPDLRIPDINHRTYRQFDVGYPDWNIVFKIRISKSFSGRKSFHKLVKTAHLLKNNLWITTHTTDIDLTKSDTWSSIFFSLNAIDVSPITVMNILKGFEKP